MFLYGKNSVFERLKFNPASVEEVLLAFDFDEPATIKLLETNRIPTKRISRKEMNRVKADVSSGGIIARVSKFTYAHLEDLLRTDKNNLSFIFLDRIFDPQNLGAIIRSAACFGGFALIIPGHRACRITESVVHVASGGENFVPVAMVANLTNALLEVKKNGYWIVGAVTRNGEDIAKINLPFPLGVVLGSEGKGIRYGIEKHLDIKASIPMRGAPLSFNVTSACNIFCYEITRQKLLSA